ncbi:unnamed protein product, partial [Vitis vinifera]
MAFTGTLDKCKACDKTVYVVDLLSADGASYHKTCFKCSHCKGTLVMSNYSSMDGVLYCKPHFEQLFKESGNFSKNFQTSAKPADKLNELSRAPSKLSSMFSGTQDKCSACRKTVYPLEKVTLEGESYHKSCFKCAHGGCPLTHSSYAATHKKQAASNAEAEAKAEAETKAEAEGEAEAEPEHDQTDQTQGQS